MTLNAICIGNFDGCHKGHQKLFESTKRIAQDNNLRPCVLTFDPHPNRFFSRIQSGAFELMTSYQKIKACEEFGIEEVYFETFDANLTGHSPADFFEKILREKYRAGAVIVGNNFRFGHQRSGDQQTLMELGKNSNVVIHVEEQMIKLDDQTTVSSSLIRQLLERDGNVELVSNLLGRPYRIDGKVVQGKKIGRTLGFPTANMDLLSQLTPANGVYCGWTQYENDPKKRPMTHVDPAAHPCMMNIGVNPTVSGNNNIVPEVHLFNQDTQLDLYDKTISVYITHKIRQEKKFPDLSSLVQQLNTDKQNSKRILKI